MTQEYVIQRKGAVISEGENSFVPEKGLRAEEFEHIDINGEDYVKVKKTEYELLSILAIKGLKLLNEKINELERKLKN